MSSITSFILLSLWYEVFETDAAEGTSPEKQVQYLFENYLDPNKETLEHYSGFNILLENNIPHHYTAQLLE